MILSEEIIRKYHNNPEGLADYFFHSVFTNGISYPINPFAVLSEIGIPFVFRNFKELEGILIVDERDRDNSLIAINAKRPIQRQRYSCVHEICHYLKDIGLYDPYSCKIGSRSRVERYAESFASCFLMPRKEMVKQVMINQKGRFLSFDEILKISDYFGVSFQACLYRIKSCVPSSLAPRWREDSKKFKPNQRRNMIGLNDTSLYLQLLDNWPMMWTVASDTNASYSFKNRYVFNDARLEGLDVSLEEVSESIADIRENKGVICSEYPMFAEIAGHSELYDMIFRECHKRNINSYLYSVAKKPHLKRLFAV